MRDYKFRGKRIDNGEWVYGYYVYTFEIGYNSESYDDVPPRKHYIFGNSNDFHEVNPETVGQYTGMTDCKGTEIYEGTIIKQTYHAERGSVHDGTDESFDGHHIGEVVIIASKGVCMRNPLCWSMETDETTRSNQYKSVASYRCVAVGNVWDNPELQESL